MGGFSGRECRCDSSWVAATSDDVTSAGSPAEGCKRLSVVGRDPLDRDSPLEFRQIKLEPHKLVLHLCEVAILRNDRSQLMRAGISVDVKGQVTIRADEKGFL